MAMKYLTEKQAWNKIIKIFIDFSKTKVDEYKLDFNTIKLGTTRWSYHKINGICGIIDDLQQGCLISSFIQEP